MNDRLRSAVRSRPARRGAASLVIVAASLTLLGPAPASASAPTWVPTSAETLPFTTGPSVTLDRDEVRAGEHIVVSISGFGATAVTISICGNEARRGSGDCNMTASEGVRLDDGDPTLADMPIAPPPTDCPCVVRVSTRTGDEVAITPFTLTDHPIGPVVDGVMLDDPLAVSISARPNSDGLIDSLRPSLGGPTTYSVTVTVKNRSTVPLTSVRVFGSARRGSDDDLATLELSEPGVIEPGQTWQETVIAVIPAPSFGDVEWRASASGVGTGVASTSTTQHQPLLLLVMLLLLVADMAVIGIRFAVRRHIARATAIGAADVTIGSDVTVASA